MVVVGKEACKRGRRDESVFAARLRPASSPPSPSLCSHRINMTAFSKARELIDAAHATDPSGAEQLYADSVEAWAVRFLSSEFPSASSRFSSLLVAPSSEELVRLGARCQHLERFKTPRDSFPEGKAGYLKWRRSLYVIQADRARELLLQAGVEEEQADMVRKWVSKADLQPGKEDEGDAGTQVSRCEQAKRDSRSLGLVITSHSSWRMQPSWSSCRSNWHRLQLSMESIQGQSL